MTHTIGILLSLYYVLDLKEYLHYSSKKHKNGSFSVQLSSYT